MGDDSAFLTAFAATFALDPDMVGPDSGLWDDLGLDSVDAMRMLAWVEDDAGAITPGPFPPLMTVADVIAHHRYLQGLASAS